MSEKNKDEKNGQAVISASSLPSDVKKAGVLRKLKTMKKKYFVLRKESENGPARLEYYDNEKKFRSGVAPKRSIIIKKCFNINRKVDAKQKLAIALYTKDDCFSVVAETEQLLEEWLKAMLELQLDGTSVNGGTALKPKFEHVWQVTIGEKSLACSRNLKGLHRLCLTNTCLTLVKMDQSDNPETVEFPLMSIRRCGHSNNYFLIELGRSSITGAGELWLETEDVVIAQNMHEVTLKAMKSCRELEDMGPHRPRSSSNTETSRPIQIRRPVAVVSAQPNPYPSIRDRCDSMPSRPRTISEGQEINNRSYYASPNHPIDSLRSHTAFPRTVSYSPPGISNPLSPCSTACSTDSAGSSLSIDEYDAGSTQNEFAHGRYSHNMPTESAILIEPPIKEEQPDDYLPMSAKNSKETSGYMHMGAAASSYSSSAPSGPSLSLNLTSSESSKTTTTTSVSQNSEYVEMMSPSSPPGDYLPMSPLTTKVTVGDKDDGQNASVSSSPKVSECYLYMAPASSSSPANASRVEGYVDMAPLSSSLPKITGVLSGNTDRFSFHTTSCASDTSVNSSSDASKSEVYHLEKVKSLLTDTDDTSEDYIRPVRAYSMGSRPQPKKTHLSIHNDGSRIRAYSVGSQAVSMRNKIVNSADYDLGSLKRIDTRTGAKSSSAPLLHNRPPRLRSSASRGDVGEDLMEIDYNKTRHLASGISLHDSEFTIEPVGRSRSGSYSSSGAWAKVERRDRPLHERDKTVFHGTGQVNLGSSESFSSYVPMSPAWASAKSSSGPAPTVQIKAVEHVAHPAGDYVSLDPSFRYPSVNVVLPNRSSSSGAGGGGGQPGRAFGDSTSSSQASTAVMNHNAFSQASKDVNSSFETAYSAASSSACSSCCPNSVPNVTATEKVKMCDVSDYMDMNFGNSANSTPKTVRNNPCEGDVAEDKTCLSLAGKHASCQGDITAVNSSSSSHADVMSSVPCTCVVNPNADAVASTISGEKQDLQKPPTCAPDKLMPVPATDNPHPNYASSSPVLSALADNSVAIDGGVTLIMPVHRTRLQTNAETKEVPLTYAEIDFSSVATVPDEFKGHPDNLSHL